MNNDVFTAPRKINVVLHICRVLIGLALKHLRVEPQIKFDLILELLDAFFKDLDLFL